LSKNELSYIDVAEEILGSSSDPLDLYDLFDQVVASFPNLSKDENMDNIISNFYNDLTSSAKFVYLGSNHWDLKNKHGVEIWEKDGSYYNEYKEVYDEAIEGRLANAEVKEQQHQAMLDARREKELMIQAARESQDSPALNINDDEVIPFDLSEELEDLEENLEELYFDDDAGLEEDEFYRFRKTSIDEDSEDFDEEEYNKIMDDYEDQYEDL
jgi:DNA-directed RNA polymerase subunit delta